MKYYVLFEEYYDYNQFEGEWRLEHRVFDSYSDAEKFYTEISGNSNYSDIVGPLSTSRN